MELSSLNNPPPRTTSHRHATLIAIAVIAILAQPCTACPPHCRDCQSPASCTTCEQAYYLDDANLCDACMPGCLACGGRGLCDACSDRLALLLGACEPCADSRCLACRENPGVCSKCARGFQHNSEGKCVYRWQTYLSISLLIAVFIMFLIAGICCFKTHDIQIDDTEIEDEDNQYYRKNSKGVMAQRKFSDLLPASVKGNDDRGIYVSIIQNIGADSAIIESNQDEVEEQEKESFFSINERLPLGAFLKKRSLDIINLKDSYEPTLPASQI